VADDVQSATNFCLLQVWRRDAAGLVQDAFAIIEHCSQIEFNEVKTYLLTAQQTTCFLNTIKTQ
jgi:hypothetical protein